MNKKPQTFEDFLKDKHYEQNPQLLDDDLSDAYDNWEPDVEQVIAWAEEWGNPNHNSPVKMESEYYTVNLNHGEFNVSKSWWNNDEVDKGRLKNQLYFKTEEEAKKKVQELINALA